ncbi:MAG: hypothetical protein ABI863_10385 [Ginsengibacter sp.]
MDNTIKKIIEETGTENVKDIFFDASKNKWVISYTKDSWTREFDFFDEVYEFLTNTKR